MTQPIDVEHVNAIIRQFGENQRADMRAERRETMSSMLFDLPRRSLLGWQCIYEHAGTYLRELYEAIEPDELGRRMRTPGCRPYTLQPFIVMCSYLGAREQRILDLGVRPGEPFPEEDLETIALVADFWERLMRAYRDDGFLLPAERDGTLAILDDDVLGELSDRTRPAGPNGHASVRRMGATLDLFTFILHGEQRDGIFGHGPYRTASDHSLFVKEWNDLRNDYLPWAPTDLRLPVENVIVAYVANDVRVVCDMFGSITVHPHEIDDRLARLGVFTNESGALRELRADEVAAVQEAAAAASEDLYLRAIEWDDRYKIEYGGALFANHLAPFFTLAGVKANVKERIMASFQETADRMVPGLLAGERPSIWAHMARSDVEFFSPVTP